MNKKQFEVRNGLTQEVIVFLDVSQILESFFRVDWLLWFFVDTFITFSFFIVFWWWSLLFFQNLSVFDLVLIKIAFLIYLFFIGRNLLFPFFDRISTITTLDKFIDHRFAFLVFNSE